MRVLSVTVLLLLTGVSLADEKPTAPPDTASSNRPGKAAVPIANRDLERLRQAADARAIHLLMLQQANAARQQTILGISNAAAAGHDVNMRIIDNMRPTGRYEYNPATGRYDRFVPR